MVSEKQIEVAAVDNDRAMLSNLSDREVEIANAATRLAYDRVGDWLSQKQAKAENFPGRNVAYSSGCAAAYQNAAQTVYVWAISLADLRAVLEAAEKTGE
jgi:hypothetical protein